MGLESALASARADAGSDPLEFTLLEIVRDMNRRLPLPALLRVICERTVEAFELERATVFDYHRRARGYVPLADFGTPPHIAARYIDSHYTTSTTPHRDEIVAGCSVVIRRGPDLTPEDLALLDQAEADTIVLLPLVAEQQTRGLLSACLNHPHDVTPDDVRRLEVVAHHAATAIAQARSLRASEKASRFRAALATLALDLSAATSRAPALALLCARARAMFRASSAVLLLPAAERLVPVAEDGEVDGFSPPAGVPLAASGDAAVRALTTGEVVVDDVDDRPADTAHRFRSALAIPLVGHDEAAGVLLLGETRRTRHFDPAVADEARVLGALAATILRNLDLMTHVQAANAELRRVSTLKDTFLASVSHDLRTPLNVIVGYAQLAREGVFGTPPAELDGILERIVLGAREQLALVEDLLDLSRIELDRLAVRPATVPLAPLFTELDFALARMVKDGAVRAVVREPGALGVHADPDRLRQICLNLLGNAAKFTHEGSVELDAVADGSVVRISVRDTGPGIAPDDLARIFEPFQQAAGPDARLGAGLGLAICRRLATLMHGTLDVESTVGRGSVFRLTLPLA